MFTRDKIATKKAFELFRSVRVPNDSGGATEQEEFIKLIYGKVRNATNRRTDEEGQMVQDVTHIVETDYFKPYPQVGDYFKRGGTRYVIHSVDNKNEFNEKLLIKVARS